MWRRATSILVRVRDARQFSCGNVVEMPRRGQDGLRPFIKSQEEVKERNNILLDPLASKALRKKPPNCDPKNAKLLRVNVVGVPNAGKSTLVNSLVGSNICAHSNKVHTTRQNAIAVISQENTQIIFQDTPGLITQEEKKKYKLEDPMYEDPYSSCIDSDLIIVVQDVSSRFVREAINKKVLDLLIRNPDVPAVLVLNKMDTIPHSRRVYDLIRKLTCGQLAGQRQIIKKNVGPSKAEDLETYFMKRKKRQEAVESEGCENNSYSVEKIKIASYDDLLRVIKSDTSGYDMEKMVENLCLGLPGWPGFKDVFTISALNGNGVQDLKDYLFYNAKPGQWVYHQDVQTNEDPRHLVLKICKSKFLDVLKYDIPYKLKPQIQSWQVENGVLRLLIQIDSHKPIVTHTLLYNKKGAVVAKIGRLIENDLQNLFHCEVFVLINVNVTHKLTTPPHESVSVTRDAPSLL